MSILHTHAKFKLPRFNNKKRVPKGSRQIDKLHTATDFNSLQKTNKTIFHC